MNLTTMILLSLSISVDVLALAAATGLKHPRRPSRAFRLMCTGIWTVTTTALLLSGWLIGDVLLTEWLAEHRWVAGTGLTWVGLQMIFANGSPPVAQNSGPVSIAGCLVHGLIVSVDSCVLGAAFALKQLPILRLAIIVCFVTAAMSLLGFGLARHFRRTAGRQAEVVGGAFLLAVGAYHICC